jgi:raffinose/stachyose/melibiose transport system permease protein/N-acetylglucosamine transport system permease protein
MRHSRKKIQIFPVIIWTVLFVWTLVFLALIAWAFITSLKTVFNFYQDPIGLPQEKYGGWQFENYVNAFNAIKINKNGIWIGVPGLFKNSMLFVLGNATLSVLTACIASYVLAKYSYIRWVKSLWALVLITKFMPIGTSTSGNIVFLHSLHLYDSMAGNWLVNCGAFGATFLIYYATWKSVSWTYAEAAFIEGAGHARVMISIMFPMTVTIFGVLFLQKFIELWNNYTTPIVYLPSYPTLSYGAWAFQFSSANPEVAVAPVQLAGLLTLASPVFILFIIFRNKLMGSLTMGGLKG